MRLIETFRSILAAEAPATATAPGAAAEAAAPPRGFRDPKGAADTRRIVVTVSEPTFAAISRRARGAQVSVAEATRRLITRGLRAARKEKEVLDASDVQL